MFRQLASCKISPVDTPHSGIFKLPKGKEELRIYYTTYVGTYLGKYRIMYSCTVLYWVYEHSEGVYYSSMEVQSPWYNTMQIYSRVDSPSSNTIKRYRLYLSNPIAYLF